MLPHHDQQGLSDDRIKPSMDECLLLTCLLLNLILLIDVTSFNTHAWFQQLTVAVGTTIADRPPAQIRTCAFTHTALYQGCVTAKRAI